MTASTYGRYIIIRSLGSGGMADVYLARDPRLDREVAIKVPHAGELSGDTLARMANEAHLVAQLEGPAIVPLYEFGEQDGLPYLVIRYMPGGSLAARLTEGSYEPDEALPIIERVAAALDYAHSRGVIHRDVKPGNILFDANGAAYLSDFGIARFIDPTSDQTAKRLTATGFVHGTAAYLSPEQAQGLRQPDGRSDIYSLGVVLFEMLTGDVPYHAESSFQQAVQHITAPIPSIIERRPDLPAALQTVIERAMAKQPDARYPTATELAADLRRVTAGHEPLTASVVPLIPVADLPLTPAPPPPAATPAPPAAPDRRRAVPLWAWGGLLAVVGLALAAGIALGNRGERARVAPTAKPTAAETAAVSAAAPKPTLTRPATSTATAAPAPTEPPATEPPATLAPLSPPGNFPLTEQVLVPAGPFLMGSDAGEDDAAPARIVTLDAFWIDKTEVTNAQYAAFLNEQGNQVEGGVTWVDFSDEQVLLTTDGSLFRPKDGYADHPVVEVSWYGAQAYCRRVGRRLPTEAEWEKAARGEDGRTYPWGEEPPACAAANFWEQPDGCISRTTPVGSYPDGVSPYGALDMAGNVWEWVEDWYDPTYYSTAAGDNPTGPQSGESRVQRGGSYFDPGRTVRTFHRFRGWPINLYRNVGFRCAADAAVGVVSPRPALDVTDTPVAPTGVVLPTATSTAAATGNEPDAAELPFFMTRLLTLDDLAGLSQWELDVMRNEIFARYGRGFNRADLQAHFDAQPWYTRRYDPEDFPTDRLLTEVQKQNAALILTVQEQNP